jgi:hypothetical protein
MDWKNNKRIQIAVGIAVVVLAFRWLFSNTVSNALLAYNEPPLEEGSVGDPMTALAMIWPFVELAMAILGAIGLYVLNAGEWIWAKAQGTSDQPMLQESTVDSPVASINPEAVQRDLARAVAINDTAEVEKLKVLVRRPYALGELVEAVNGGKWDKAEGLFSELRSMQVGDSK